MNLSKLAPRDRVECNVRGVRFAAKALSANKGLVRIEPESSWATWRFLPPSMIERALVDGEPVRER